jgi:hypothetical protein
MPASDALLQSQCAEGLECPTAINLCKLNTIIKGDNGDYSKSLIGRMQTIETYMKVGWALTLLVMPLLTALAVKWIGAKP